MRRLPLLLVIGVLPMACARAPDGPEAPIALEQAPPAPALEGGSARQTVLDLVEAYAAAAWDGGASLADLVTGPELERWVLWLGVQNAQFPGRVDGSREVRTVALVGTAPVDRALGAQVDLGATVTFAYAPAGGEPFERTRILDGPVTLVSTRPGDWRVLDLTRDGVPMSDGIELFEDEIRTDHGLSVRLDSLFMFTPNWQFNVVVENDTGHEALLDPEATALYVRRAGGGFDVLHGALSPALALLPTGVGVQGAVSYPLQDSAEGRVLVLVFRSEDREYRFDFPLEDIVTLVPPPPPTAAGGSPQVG
jgi:hypothetical protein